MAKLPRHKKLSRHNRLSRHDKVLRPHEFPRHNKFLKQICSKSVTIPGFSPIFSKYPIRINPNHEELGSITNRKIDRYNAKMTISAMD